jgi:hypothetical protein
LPADAERNQHRPLATLAHINSEVNPQSLFRTSVVALTVLHLFPFHNVMGCIELLY